MSIEINKEIVKDIMAETDYKAELAEFLNSAIDDEIAKGDDMDDGLVSECVDILLELDEGSLDKALEKIGKGKNIIKLAHRKNFAKKNIARSVAAVLAFIIVTHGVAYRSATAYQNAVDRFVNEIVGILENAAKKTEDGGFECADIDINYPDGFEKVIHSEDEASLEGFTVTAYDFDDNRIQIPVTECETEKTVVEEDGQKYVLITVTYKGCVKTVTFTLAEGE